jgi:hypothetical protein
MPYSDFLGRIRRLFKSDSDPCLEDITRALHKDMLVAPSQPMSDQELARAISEFQASVISDWAPQKLSKRLADGSKSTACGGRGNDGVGRSRRSEPGAQ